MKWLFYYEENPQQVAQALLEMGGGVLQPLDVLEEPAPPPERKVAARGLGWARRAVELEEQQAEARRQKAEARRSKWEEAQAKKWARTQEKNNRKTIAREAIARARVEQKQRAEAAAKPRQAEDNKRGPAIAKEQDAAQHLKERLDAHRAAWAASHPSQIKTASDVQAVLAKLRSRYDLKEPKFDQFDVEVLMLKRRGWTVRRISEALQATTWVAQ